MHLAGKDLCTYCVHKGSLPAQVKEDNQLGLAKPRRQWKKWR